MQPGQQLGKTHGAYSKVAVERLDEQAREIHEALASDAPVYEPADTVAVHMLAEALCRLQDVQAWIEANGVFDTRRKSRRGKGEEGGAKRKSRDPMRALEMEDRLVRRIERLTDALGMTPTSRARLGLDMARTRDIAQEMAERDRRTVDGEAEDA